MSIIKKLKKLLQQDTSPNTETSDTVSDKRQNTKRRTKLHAEPQSDPKSNLESTESTVVRICTWLDKQGWKYEHRTPSDGADVHHLIMGFSDEHHDWTCVLRVQDKNDLVSIFGVLDDTVPVTHYTAVLMAIAKINLNISYGNLELDPADGEVRVKIAFDGEFTDITDKSLGCYLQAVASMTELAHNIVALAMADDKPSQFAYDYMDKPDEITAKVGDTRQSFFVPTHVQQ